MKPSEVIDLVRSRDLPQKRMEAVQVILSL
jgi:hypothetical protein